MNIEDLTIAQAREIAAMFNGGSKTPAASHSFDVGQAYLIRTVTMIYTGRVKSVTDSDVALMGAAWIADTGRFTAALRDGTLSEVEPYPDVCYVSRAAIVDFSIWEHQLPREQK